MCDLSGAWKKKVKVLETENARLTTQLSAANKKLGYSPTVDVPSPRDLVKQSDIAWLKGERKIEIRNLPGEIWLTTVADTKSMDPVVDAGHTALLTGDFDKDELLTGDVIVFKLPDKSVMHRIIEVGEDGEGKYYKTKGDNTYYPDPYVIRAENITHLLIGIIY